MKSNLEDKIKGALYGFAIGDAMGATTEFMSKKEIALKYGKVKNIIGEGWLNLEAGEVTDDTQMMMCIIDAIIKSTNKNGMLPYGVINTISENFVKWLATNPIDVGNQCRRSINLLSLGEHPLIDDEALGNGSLMRSLPFALIGLLQYNLLQGQLTHNNIHCSLIVSEYSQLIGELLLNKNIGKELICLIRPLVHSELVDEFKLVEPSGHIDSTYNNALLWASKPSFREAIIGAVNDGGDADTIAAITGSISGAIHGYKRIPRVWVEALNKDTKNKLNIFAKYVYNYYQL